MYLLSKDDDTIKFDERIHTDQKLYLILEELYLEYAMAYVFYYRMMLNLKESNELESKIQDIEETIKEFTASKDEAICRKHKINTVLL